MLATRLTAACNRREGMTSVLDTSDDLYWTLQMIKVEEYNNRVKKDE